MQIILLERVPKLGQMGEVVSVKPGYARNFLIPHGKALRATKASIGDFEKRRTQLEARNLERKQDAQADGGQGRRPERHPPAPGQRDQPALRLGQCAATSPTAFTEAGITLERQQIRLDQPLKTLGLHESSWRCIPRSRSRSR